MQSSMPSLQMSYLMQQNSRVTTEACRSAYQSHAVINDAAGGMPWIGPGHANRQSVDTPPAEKCIGQVVLDWEFIHDLDLHLLKVEAADSTPKSNGGRPSSEPEPNPEPSPLQPRLPTDLESCEFDLGTLVNPETNDLRLNTNQILRTIVYYGNKVRGSQRGGTPQAVLQLDRNAEVHSHKPVENLYLTETLDVGIYVVAVHNYSQRQLQETVIGPSSSHTYRSFDEFKKRDPGYQLMEKALDEQVAHINDEDGTPEKVAIMARIEEQMLRGSQLLQGICHSGSDLYGVHYGVTVYTYPDQVTTTAQHPQGASLEELERLFKSDFFATSECVFDPSRNAAGYNAVNVLADVSSSDGRLALSAGKAAYVTLLRVSRDPSRETARIAEVKMLAGTPRPGAPNACDIGGRVNGMVAMNAFRMGHMTSSRRQQMLPSGHASHQLTEPFPEPSASSGAAAARAGGAAAAGADAGADAVAAPATDAPAAAAGASLGFSARFHSGTLIARAFASCS